MSETDAIERIIEIALPACSLIVASCVLFLGLELRSRLLRFDGELYTVTALPTPGVPEHFFMSLHGLIRPPLRRLLAGQPWISLELVGHAGELHFQMWIPTGEKSFVESLLRSAYPGLELTPVSDPPVEDLPSAVAAARLSRGHYLPIRTAFTTEPLASALWTLARTKHRDELVLQLLVRPKPSTWQVKARLFAQGLRDQRPRGRSSFFFGTGRDAPTQFERDTAAAIEEKAEGIGFDCLLRVVAVADQVERAREYVRSLAASVRPFSGSNSFDFGGVLAAGRFRDQVRRRAFSLRGSFLLTARELAGLWHLPSDAPPHLEVVRSPKIRPPAGASRGERLLGYSTWGTERTPVRLSVADSGYHLHLLGATGTGKTTAMTNLAAQEIVAGRGVGVLDPKGDLVRALLPLIPSERRADVVLITPEDTNVSVGINPLELWPGDDRDLVADNALTIFKRIYERYWGPRTDDVLRSALLTLLRHPNSTLAHIPVLLTDPDFRERILKEVVDPFGLDGFWAQYEALSEMQRGDAIGPVLNKLRDFLVRPRLRRLLCQPHSTVDLRKVVDGGQILLADLSIGRWGETTATLIGSFLLAKIWQAVLARSAQSEDERRDFFLFVDEFQHFVGIAGSFADVLAEARSLRLSLTIANQHLGQLTRDLREAVASNARSRLVFQCGQEDAAHLAREFAPLDAAALMALARFEAAARLSIDGTTSPTFTLRTLPPRAGVPTLAADARAAMFERFAKPVGAIDQELAAAVSLSDDSVAETAAGRRRLRPSGPVQGH
jgi:hypothetical protein